MQKIENGPTVFETLKKPTYEKLPDIQKLA